MTGHSFAPVLADADAPATNTLQYFEMAGSRALVAGRWKAVCKHVQGADFDTEPWELYDLAADASECHDLAAAHPERLAELIELWWERGRASTACCRSTIAASSCSAPASVSARRTRRAAATSTGRRCRRSRRRPRRRSAAAASTSRPGSPERPATTACCGPPAPRTRASRVFVQDDRLVVDYNAFDDHTVVESTVPVPTGEVELTARFRRGDGHGRHRRARRRRRRRRPRRPGAVHADDLVGRLQPRRTTTARPCRPATARRSPSPACCTRSSSSSSRRRRPGNADGRRRGAEMARQ